MWENYLNELIPPLEIQVTERDCGHDSVLPFGVVGGRGAGGTEHL